MDERDVPASVDRPAADIGIAVGQGDEQKRIESLLIDDSDSLRSFAYIAEQEVRVVNSGKNRFGSLLALSLLCALLFGVGYYYLTHMSAQQPPVTKLSLYVSPKLPVPARPIIDIPATVAAVAEETSSPDLNTAVAEKKELETKKSVVTPRVDIAVPLFTVTVGPFINDDELQQAMSRLQEFGFQPQKKPGRGQVTMIRLLEGIYPEKEARMHLVTLKEVTKTAFLLPDGKKLAVYAGSFHQEIGARQLQAELAHEMINVALVDSKITMNGTMLTALQADQQTAREVAAHISSLGLQTQVIEKK
ncbi:MAG: hypothetical protein PF441_07595 [Desulfuromusa sp.]|nr:hypothetical protein [Desulfuromusa sp.]